MLDRLINQSLIRIPGTRSCMEHGNFIFATVCLQLPLQQLLEQVVKAIPPVAPVQGHKKGIRAIQLLQGGLHLRVRGITPHNRSTQPGAELL